MSIFYFSDKIYYLIESVFYYINPIEFAAILISVCAFFLSFYSAVQTRDHNKLSVKPYLRIDSTLGEKIPCSIRLFNNGFGPAIIESFDVYIDNQIVSRVGQTNILTTALLKLNINSDLYVCFEMYPKESLRAGAEPALIHEREDIDFHPSIRREFIDGIKRLSIIIKYTSIYNEGGTVRFPNY